MASVREHRDFGGDYRLLALEAPSVAGNAQPGQFVHLKIPSLDGAVLRRPFSIYGADDGVVRVLYKAVGRGTRAMLHLAVGDEVSILGPLGNGFPLEVPTDRHVVAVAGGYGVAPLSFLARRLGREGTIFIGGATARDILCVRDFGALNWDVVVTTEDGSMGVTGRVTDALDPYLADDATGELEIFACGPDGMLKAVGDRAVARGDRAWLSMDKHMGCGIGACLACVQAIRDEDGSVFWMRVCRDGPVFDARTVVWG